MTAEMAIPQPEIALGNLTGKYLTFTLQGESYGVEVLKVREIIRHLDITAMPQMPDYSAARHNPPAPISATTAYKLKL